MRFGDSDDARLRMLEPLALFVEGKAQALQRRRCEAKFYGLFNLGETQAGSYPGTPRYLAGVYHIIA